MSLLLGLDIGSTSIKANIYDLKGNLVSGASTPTELAYPEKEHPGWSIWDPDTIWEAVKNSIKKAVASIDSKENIKAVAVAGFGMDGVPVDKNGKWLYPFISWHCPRTEKQSREWSEKVGADEIFYKSGKQVMHIDTVYRILWIKENHPEILEKTYKWLLIEDYVNYLLCGEVATDLSMASCTSLLDQRSRDWSEELVGQAGFDISILPPVQASGTVLGNISPGVSSQTGLSTDTKVVLGGHDYHCGALAVGAFVPEVVMDIVGTWEMVFQSSHDPRLEEKVFKNGISVESHVAKDMYNTVAYSVSGGMLEWLNKTICFEERLQAKNNNRSEWKEMMLKAEASPVGSNGMFFAPYFCGAGSPIVDNRASGAYVGLTDQSDKGAIIRSTIEGLNYQFKDMLEAFEKASGSSSDKVVAAGGAIKNKFWMQNKADVTGKRIEVPEVEEATPLGAAILAGIGVGEYKDEQDAYRMTYKTGPIYEPDENNNREYDEYYKIYKRLYFDLKDLNENIYQKFNR